MTRSYDFAGHKALEQEEAARRRSLSLTLPLTGEEFDTLHFFLTLLRRCLDGPHKKDLEAVDEAFHRLVFAPLATQINADPVVADIRQRRRRLLEEPERKPREPPTTA